MEQTNEKTEQQNDYTALIEAKYKAEDLEEIIETLKEEASLLRDHYKTLKAEYNEKYPEA